MNVAVTVRAAAVPSMFASQHVGTTVVVRRGMPTVRPCVYARNATRFSQHTCNAARRSVSAVSRWRSTCVTTDQQRLCRVTPHRRHSSATVDWERHRPRGLPREACVRANVTPREPYASACAQPRARAACGGLIASVTRFCHAFNREVFTLRSERQ